MKHILIKSLTALIVVHLFVVFAVGAHPAPALQQTAEKTMGGKAVLVIKRKRTESLKGYLLIVCKASLWKALEKDSDLGPFLKHKKAASNLEAIVAMPENPKNGSTYAVYFQDNKPIGLVEIKTGQGEKVTQENIAKAYTPITEDVDQGAANQISFETKQVYSDDDQPIPTLQVVSDAVTPANPEGDYRSGAIKSPSGYVLVWNQPNNYYVLEIKGKDVRQTSTERKLFSVDGKFLQVVDAAVANIIQAAGGQKLPDKAVLEAHRDWETKFLESEYKSKLKIESSWQKLTNGKDALWWMATVPESIKTNVKKQVYLTVVQGNYVLMLGGAVTEVTDESAAQQLLLTTIETLKTSDKPTDLQKLRDAILKESPGEL